MEEDVEASTRPHEKHESVDPVDKKKRRFIFMGTGLLCGIGGYALGLDKLQKNAEAGATLLKEIGDEVRSLRDRSGDLSYRVDLLRKLFRVSGHLRIPPPTQHIIHHKPGPHDIAAMAVGGLMYPNPRSTDVPSEAPLAVVDSLFAVGSPVSSQLASEFIPTNGARLRNRVELIVNRHVFPYQFLGGESSNLTLKSATMAGSVRVVRNSGLAHRGDAWYPPAMADRNNWLQTDFLLLTVMPWNTGGGRAIFASGGHGPGTHALELLAKPAFPLSKLEKLVADMESADAFQVVFEVPIDHNGIHSSPSSIRISSDLPPRRIESGRSLFTKPDDKLLHAVSGALS
jgi:hypothetical protein